MIESQNPMHMNVNYITIVIVEMKRKLKQKRIEKESHKKPKQSRLPQSQPQLKHLSDFVTCLAAKSSFHPIYTGGRILSTATHIYATCEGKIAIFTPLDPVMRHIAYPNEQILNFSLGSTLIAVFSSSELLRMVHMETHSTVQVVRLKNLFPYDMCFSPNNNHLGVCFANGEIRIYTVSKDMRQTHVYRNHRQMVMQVEWHPQHLQLMSVDQEGTFIIFDYILNKVVMQVRDAGTAFVYSKEHLYFVNGSTVRCMGYGKSGFKWVLDTNMPLCCIYAQNNALYFGGESTALHTMDVSNSTAMRRVSNTIGNDSAVKIMRMGAYLVTVSSEQLLTLMKEDEVSYVAGYNDEILDIKYSKSEYRDYMVLVTNSATVQVIDRQTQSIRWLIHGHTQIVLCCEYYHPYLVTGGKDRLIKLWYIDSAPILIATYIGHAGDVTGVGVCKEKNIIVSVSEDRSIKQWPLLPLQGTPMTISSSLNTTTAHDKAINAIRVHRDTIATCSHDRSAKLYNMDLSLLHTLRGHKRGVLDCAFHPIQHTLVTAGGEGALKAWDTVSGEMLWSLGEGKALLRCCWLYYHQIVTGSSDGVVKVWDVRKKTSLSYDKHGGKVWAVDVLEGECVTGGNDSVYVVWRDNTEEKRHEIMVSGEEEETMRNRMKEHVSGGQYREAAIIAFDRDYNLMFSKLMSWMVTSGEDQLQVEFGEDNEMIRQQVRSKENIGEIVEYMVQKDINKLMKMLLAMNSTVAHFKAANKILLQVLKIKKIKGLMELDKTFSMQVEDKPINKETDFQQFLAQMQNYTHRHAERIRKYIRSTYWIDHLHQE